MFAEKFTGRAGCFLNDVAAQISDAEGRAARHSTCGDAAQWVESMDWHEHAACAYSELLCHCCVGCGRVDAQISDAEGRAARHSTCGDAAQWVES